jgi:hypothetical protein
MTVLQGLHVFIEVSLTYKLKMFPKFIINLYQYYKAEEFVC